MTNLQDLQTKCSPNWCPGCGDFGIQAAVKNAIVEMDLDPAEIAISTGIGCGSKINQWVNTYGFAGLHGRSVPVAMGIKLANPELTVIDVGGDGDGYGIGMGHFINTMRRNLNITYIVQNNQIYGLTLGQTSPTSEKGAKGPSTPQGVIEEPVNPIRLALSSDATFIARGFAGDIKHLTELIVAGINHKGFSLIDVLQPCATFNKVNTFKFFRERVYKLEEVEGYDKTDLSKAFEIAGEWGDKIATGVFYQVDKPVYEDCDPGLRSGNPVKADISAVDIGAICESFM
jgi:2-oxoglutarate/2-oxoacid ferredoxin oxidoreductase subunit beta